MPRDAPGEPEIPRFLFGRLPRRDRHPALELGRPGRGLGQEPSEKAPRGQGIGSVAQQVRRLQHHQILPRLLEPLGGRLDRGRHHHLEEEAPDRLERRVVQRPIHPEDTPERRERVGVSRERNRRRDGGGDRGPGRIPVLHHDRGGLLELVQELERCLDVEVVVVGESLPAHLGERRDAAAPVLLGVDRPLLPRVLAVAELLQESVSPLETLRQRARSGGLRAGGGEVAGDRRVVGGGPLEGAPREFAGQRRRHRSSPAVERLDHLGVLRGLHDRQHVGVVLGGGADQGRAADIDLLDRFGFGYARAFDGLLERIEIHDHELDGDDPVMMTLLLVHRVPAAVENAAVHGGVERLDPAAEELRVAGDLADVADRDARVPERGGGATGGDDLDAVARQPVRELDQADLVRDRKKRAAYPDIAHRGRALPVIPASASS